jgi:hypothetical protein
MKATALRHRLLWALSITLMTVGIIMITYALYVSAWSYDVIAYLLGGALLALYVTVQTIVAARSDRPIRRR